MRDRISIGQLYPQTLPPGSPKRAGGNDGPAGRSFQDIFHDKMIRLSHHAEVRLQQRGISLVPELVAKIEAAMDNAAAKGAKDSLFLLQDMALIVSVKNRTIVTAMSGSSLKNNLFTQIDSAVVIS